MMPIFMVGVVFGLAMDYEVFLVTRMREAYVHGERPDQAIVTGFRHGARVVTAAAVIMMAVFAGFIGSSEQMLKMIGFSLGTGSGAKAPVQDARGPSSVRVNRGGARRVCVRARVRGQAWALGAADVVLAARVRPRKRTSAVASNWSTVTLFAAWNSTIVWTRPHGQTRTAPLPAGVIRPCSRTGRSSAQSLPPGKVIRTTSSGEPGS